jgi:adenosylcobinamide-GDP ribazoletransferase
MYTWLTEEIRIFAHAVTFYTRIPLPISASFSEKRLSRCSRYFPMIGWIIGGSGALVYWSAHFVFPQTVAVALSMLSTILLTGALHEDGLADFCDGFGGGWTRERILEIMKDSRLGTYGVIGLMSTLSLKWLALGGLSQSQICFSLVASHSLSRFFSVSFMLTHDYAGDPNSSKSAALCFPMSKAGFAFTAVTGLCPLLFFREAEIFLCLVPMALLHWGLGAMWRKRIGGFTGDCLGAAQQISEVAFYLFVLGHSWISI